MGKENDQSFMRMFMGFSNGDSIGKTKGGQKAFVRSKKHRDRSQATSPPSPPSPPTPTTDSASSLGTTSSPESTKSNTDLPSEWTASQDAILVGMKVQSKTWKEIEEALPGKDRKALKERYRELYAADNKGSQGEGSGESEDKQSSKGSRKGKVKEGKGQKEKEQKGILKQSQKDQNGQWTHLEGRPVIYVQSGDPVSVEDLQDIYTMHSKADARKWVEIASRFFDKTGRRVDPELLKEKMKNVC